jgi:hypothetical protein
MKFLVLCACEKVIIDKNGAHSLINIMQNAELQNVPQSGANASAMMQASELPSNAVLPQLWFVFSIWQPSSDEVGKTFQQMHQIFWPDGTKFMDGPLEFKPDESYQQNSFGVLGFPVGQPGPVRIVTWVEDRGRPITETHEYFIRVKHAAPVSPVTAPTK